MAFRVGMKVVCIDDSDHLERTPPLGFKWAGDLDGLTEGKVYTIRSIYSHPVTGDLGVEINEIVRAYVATAAYHVSGFAAWRFRPLVTRSQAQDIAMIRELVERIDPILACELTYADEIEARMERIDRLWEAMR